MPSTWEQKDAMLLLVRARPNGLDLLVQRSRGCCSLEISSVTKKSHVKVALNLETFILTMNALDW